MNKRNKRFCVIGPSVVNDRMIERKWVGSVDEATIHAGVLLRKKPGGCRRLFVVQVVKVVELEEPPIRIAFPEDENLPALSNSPPPRGCAGEFPSRGGASGGGAGPSSGGCGDGASSGYGGYSGGGAGG